MTNRVIPQRELRNHVSSVLRDAEQGHSFTITVRGRPVAQLGPLGEGRRLEVGRESLRRILATAVDTEAWAQDLDLTEAPIDDPWNDD